MTFILSTSPAFSERYLPECGIPSQTANNAEFGVFFVVIPNKWLYSSWVDGDLKHHYAHVASLWFVCVHIIQMRNVISHAFISPGLGCQPRRQWTNTTRKANSMPILHHIGLRKTHHLSGQNFCCDANACICIRLLVALLSCSFLHIDWIFWNELWHLWEFYM